MCHLRPASGAKILRTEIELDIGAGFIRSFDTEIPIAYALRPEPAMSFVRLVTHRLSQRALVLCLVLVSLLSFGVAPAMAKGGMPEPYVSQSLDAVLMPVTKEVRAKFKLGKKAAGAVVVSVEPGGVGELYGFEPGDVISQVGGKVIRRPVDIDTMVRYWLNKGNSYFTFDGTRKNRKKRAIVELAVETYQKPIALETIGRWRGYKTPAFDYVEYYTYYQPRFYDIYEYSTYYVEQVIYTETYITAIESNEYVFYYDSPSDDLVWHDEEYITEVNEYVYSEEFYSEYTSTEVYYADDPQATAYEDTGYDEAGYDATAAGETDEQVYEEQAPETYDAAAEDGSYEEPVADDQTGMDPSAETYDESAYEDPAAAADEPVYEEPAPETYDEQAYEDPAPETYEEPAAEEPVYEEPAYEEPAYEEPAYEEPAYEEPVYEEPAYEEPVYEEPAYEEPAYEEPAQDGGGGECYYDDDGNMIC
jgi:hypothetical protein